MKVFNIAILLIICGATDKEALAQIPSNESLPVTKWSVKDPKANITCVLIQGSIEIQVQRTDLNGVSTASELRIPPTAKVNGTCGPIAQDLTLSWSAPIANNTRPVSPVLNTLQFKFWKECDYTTNATSCTYTLGAISGTINIVDSVGNVSSQYIRFPRESINYNLDDITSSCNMTEDTLKTPDGSTTIKLNNFMAQAFHSTPDQEFSENVVLCAPTPTDIGGWIGGVIAVLIILAAIGLSAYFIVKKRRLSYTAM